MRARPDDLPDPDPLVPVVFSDEGLIGNLELGSIPFSVFDLVTAEYDVRNGPDSPEREIRRLGADERLFRCVRQELEQHIIGLGLETKLFRVRDHPRVPGEPWPPDEPWPRHGMRGNPTFPSARANVEGQSIIYCADSPETALAEVRAEPGMYFTVASLQPHWPLKLVNVVGKRGLGASNPFALIDIWMSHPVNDRNRVLRPYPAINEREHYYATQLFSSIVREEGYDGVHFSSSIHNGSSTFALFDSYCLDVIDTRLFQT